MSQSLNFSEFIMVNNLTSLIFILILLNFNSCSFSSKTCRNYLATSSKKSYDVIIVPGIPFDGNQWDQIMKARVYWSKYLFDKGIAKNVMYSGSAVYTEYYEAKIMALYAIEIGIPKENVFTETKAEHSTENIYYSFHKSKNLGLNKIALASDPFQTKMLKRFTRRQVSPEVALIPIVFDSLMMTEATMSNPIINFTSAINNDFVSIITRENFWQRLRGTMGRSIDKNLYN